MRQIWITLIFIATGITFCTEGFSMLGDSTINIQLQKIDSIQLTATSRFNSLHSQYDSIDQAYTKLAGKFQHRVDSLQQLGQPADDLIHKTDSLNALKEEELYALKSKSEKLKSEVREKLNSLNLPPELSGKITEYTAALDHVDVSLPNTAFSVPELNVPELKGLNLSVPTLPELDLNNFNKIKGFSLCWCSSPTKLPN